MIQFHPNICRIFGYFEDFRDDEESKERVKYGNLVQEYCEEGTVADYIRKLTLERVDEGTAIGYMA